MRKTIIFAFTAAAALAVTTAQPMTAFAAGWTYGIVGNGQSKIRIGERKVLNVQELLGKGRLDCEAPGKPERPEIPGDVGNAGDPEHNGNQNIVGGQEAWTRQVVELVNAERAKAGLPGLIADSGAADAAQVRANEIISTFSHTRPDGSSFSTALQDAGVSYRSAGENIAYGQQSPQEVMDQWMNSAGHRANILNPDYTAIGVGHVRTAAGVDYWTQLFIR